MGGMAVSGRKKSGTGVTAARRPEVRLPPLVPYDGDGLEPDGDYDGVRFDGVDLTDASGRGARFMDCALDGCALTARCWRGIPLHRRGADGRTGCGHGPRGGVAAGRGGGGRPPGRVQLHGAVLERVVVRGGKIDYLNLREARLKDVVFEGCVLAEPDFGGAHLVRVEFRDCVLKRADFSGARMDSVDLRAVAELDIARGVDRLAGAVISPVQLMELAPAFAAQIGVRVEA